MRGITPFSPDDRAPSPAQALPDIRVVSIPAGHPYPQSVTGSRGITVLPDPRPAHAPDGQWWPPVALDPAWIRANATAADLLHIHFGTESFTPGHLAACLAAAREVGWPVVFTVHDLEHPQLSDQSGYRSQLDVLVPGADALITLTPGAAREIQRRWCRTALVLPHPAMVSEFGAGPRPATSPSLRVGMHLKDLRSNVDSLAMVTALCGAVIDLARAGRNVTGEVRMHHSVRDTATRDAIRAVIADTARVDLIEHDRLDDSALELAISSLDVAVLPYGHGTHSGWLELCWDLGIGIVAPAVGFYAEQHTDGTVASFLSEPTGISLSTAIAEVLDSPLATRPGTDSRDSEVTRRSVVRAAELELQAAVHAGLYRKLVHDRSLAPSPEHTS